MPSSFTLTADVKLNPQSLTQSASQVKQALGRITGQASEFQKSLDASTARVFAFGATTVVLNSVSQAFRKLISSTIEVEQRIVEINAIFQQSQSVINNFREAIFDVAQDTGQAFETVADAAGELARQGLTAEETATRLQAALILTRISGLGAEDSVKTLTAAINGFTSAALDAEEVTNKIVAVDTAFAVSAQDLAQGLARAGSTAEDAGVSFDQLLGLITAVEQRTARGGAVIGNAFKSIFTRLSRGSTIDDLQALGVEIDATQTGVQKLQALSTAIEGIGDPTVVSKIKELAGGVFQINVVSAALKDLTSETSVFKKATVEAANASNDAYKRNEELNKSLAAQINSLVQGITNLAAKIGTVTFGPLLTNLVSIAGKITEVFNNVLDPEKGNSIVKGFIKGIGAFISGPGLVIITAAFLKIVKLVAKFAADGFKAVLQIGSAAEKISQIEGGIVDLLSRDEKLRKIIASTTATQAQKEEAVISAIKRENQLLNEQKQLLTNITRIAAQRGVTGFNPSSGFSGGGRKRFSQGYVPNYARSGDFALEEQEAISLGASRSVRAKKGKGTIGGRSFIMNDQETEIPNFGRNGDSAVIPSYSRGYVPNFVDKKPPFNSAKYLTAGNAAKVNNSALFTEDNKAPFYPFKTLKAKSSHQELVDGAGPIIRERYKIWENRENSQTVDLTKKPFGRNPTILVPQGSKGDVASSSNGTKTRKALRFVFPVRGLGESVRPQLEASFEKNFNAKELEGKAKTAALQQANQITKVLGSPTVKVGDISKIDTVKGFTGAVRAGAGAIFDAAVTTALRLKASPAGEGGDFDVRGSAKKINRLFGNDALPSEQPFKHLGDFKFSSNAQKSMKRKTLSEIRKYPDLNEELTKEKNPKEPRKNVKSNDPSIKSVAKKTGIRRLASGYVPNFVRSSDFALEEQEAVSLGATKSVKAKKGKGTIGGKSFVMNDQETEIPNFGRNGDSAVIPSYAKGFIPNFADAVPKFEGNRYVSYGYVKNRPPTQLFTEKNTAGNYPFLTPSIENTYNELVDGAGPLLRQKFTKWKNVQNKETVSLRDDLKIPNPTVLVPQGKSGFVLDSTKSAAEGFKKIGFNFPVIGIRKDRKEQLGQEFEGKFNADEIEANAREDAVKQANAITRVLGNPRVTEAKIKDPAGFTGAIRSASGAIFDAAVTQALQLKAADPDDKSPQGDFDVRVTGGNENLSRLFSGDPTPTGGPLKGLGDFKFSSGAQKSMKGKTLKELRAKHPDIYNELKEEKAEKPKKNKFANDPTDPNPKNKKKNTAKKKAPKKAGLPAAASGYIPNFAASGILGELMRGGKDFLSPESKTKEKQGQQLAGEEKTRNFKDVFARGFIPNFALPKKAASFGGGGALGDAIKREKDSGLPTSKIRVEQSQKLVNRDNPTGLAVTNTRDEPRGLKDVFASGYVPNFAQKKEDTLEEFKKKSDTEAKTKLLYSLEKRVTKVESEIEILKRLPDKDIASNQVLDNNFANRNSSNQVPASSFASGYVPNFTRRGPLGDAIKRERDSGLPTSKIRVEQSSRLANRDNPSGLAVTNTRDEPRGLRDVFASGYVPNFASLGGGFAGFDQRTVSAQKINELEGQLERAAKSTGESSDNIDKSGKAATKMAAAFAVITTVTSITSSIEAKYAAEKQKAIKKETDKLAENTKQLEAQKKEIQASNKSARAKKREIASIDLQIAVLERNTQADTDRIESSKSLVATLAGLTQGGTQFAFALSSLNDVAGEGGLLGAFGRGKTALGGLATGAISITKKIKGNLAGKLDGLGTAFSNLGTGIGGFLSKLNKFKLPKIGTQVAAQVAGQAAGQATGQAVSGTVGGLVGGFLATAKDWAIKAGKFLGTQLLFVLKGVFVTLAAIITPITVAVALIATGIYFAIAKGADYFGQKTIDALNKKGDEGVQNIINRQADTAVANAPKEADLVAAIAKASAAGNKDEAATLKIQLEGVKDLEVAAKAYKEFGGEREKGVDAEGNEFDRPSERAKKLRSDFADANKRSKRDFGESIVATNKAIAKQKAEQLKVQIKIYSTNAETLKNQSKIAALQVKEALVRQNTIADLNRVKSLLPKDILETGGGSLVDFQVLGEQVKAGKKDVFNKEQAVSQRTSEVEAASQKVASAKTPEEEKGFQEELDKAAEGLTVASKDLVSAQSEYSNVIKNGAVQTQSNLTALADKIKNNGSEAMKKAFEEFEKIATSENIDPSQYKSAADQFFKTLDTEVKRQFAQNAIAAGDFYNKVVKNLQNPEESAKDIDTVIAGLKAANDPKNTNQEKANISTEISPLIDKLKATYGEESATFQAILKEAGLSPDQYKKQQRDIAVGQINAQKNVSKEVKKAQIADFDKQAEDKEKYKPEKYKDEQKALFDNFALLQNQLNKFRKVFPDADKILTESENLAKSLKSVGGVVDNFKSGLSGLTAFGKNADEAIQESNKNIEGLNKSTSAFSSQLETLNKTEKSIADKLVVLQAKLDKILGTTGGGGGTE